MEEKIPEMTDPLGKYWDQPELTEITFQDNRVLMTKESISKLQEYTFTIPSGKYLGKMWKKINPDGGWLLCWYGKHEDPDLLSINRVPIKEVWKSKPSNL